MAFGSVLNQSAASSGEEIKEARFIFSEYINSDYCWLSPKQNYIVTLDNSNSKQFKLFDLIKSPTNPIVIDTESNIIDLKITNNHVVVIQNNVILVYEYESNQIRLIRRTAIAPIYGAPYGGHIVHNPEQYVFFIRGTRGVNDLNIQKINLSTGEITAMPRYMLTYALLGANIYQLPKNKALLWVHDGTDTGNRMSRFFLLDGNNDSIKDIKTFSLPYDSRFNTISGFFGNTKSETYFYFSYNKNILYSEYLSFDNEGNYKKVADFTPPQGNVLNYNDISIDSTGYVLLSEKTTRINSLNGLSYYFGMEGSNNHQVPAVGTINRDNAVLEAPVKTENTESNSPNIYLKNKFSSDRLLGFNVGKMYYFPIKEYTD